MTPIAALLQPSLDALDAEASELQHRLDDLAAARTVLVDAIARANGNGVVKERAPAVKETRQASPKTAAKPAKKSSLVCPECGYEAAGPQGLGGHRRHAHGVVGSTTPQPSAPEPAKAEEFRCSEEGCGHVEPSVSALNRHCIATHKRAANADERTPA